MTLSRHTRRRVRQIEAGEGISPTELSEIGVIILADMTADDRRAWRQIARQCDRDTQRIVAGEIGRFAHERWVEILAVRLCR